MRKRFISIIAIMSILVGVASAAVTRDARWSYFRSSTAYISMVDKSIEWSGDAVTYSMPEVTEVKVSVKLQEETQLGWGTIETKTDSGKNGAGAVGFFSNWYSGRSYRVVVEAWAYNGKNQIEYIGPFYDYLDT